MKPENCWIHVEMIAESTTSRGQVRVRGLCAVCGLCACPVSVVSVAVCGVCGWNFPVRPVSTSPCSKPAG